MINNWIYAAWDWKMTGSIKNSFNYHWIYTLWIYVYQSDVLQTTAPTFKHLIAATSWYNMTPLPEG